MNYHKLKQVLDNAKRERDKRCSEHCFCKVPFTERMGDQERERRLIHGSLIAIDIEFAESILRDLLSLVP